jgi:hypothetical protein
MQDFRRAASLNTQYNIHNEPVAVIRARSQKFKQFMSPSD